MTEHQPSPETILPELLSACLKAGASGADAQLALSEGVSVAVREGKLESIEREQGQSISLRCFFGQRQAHVSGSDLSPTSLKLLVERCVAMARAVPEDKYCGLTPESDLARGALDLDLSGEPERALAALEAEALEAEAAALAVAGVKTIAGCGASWSQGTRWVAATNGFFSRKTGSTTGLGLSAIAERDGEMERDYDSWSVRRLKDRPSAEDIGRTAGERTVARLGARKVETQKAAVMFDRRVADDLLGAFLAAISGPSVARGISYLKDRLGCQVFASGIYVMDDPFRPLGFGSRAHDGEGRPVRETAIIDDGVLTGFLLNGPSARQLGMAPNGFASGGFGEPPGVTTSNVFLRAGKASKDDLMRQAGKGLLVTDMFSPSINPNTGDYSVGVAGFWFDGGQIAYPVSEVTVAGDLPSMFARLIPASDLEFRSAAEAPSVLIEDMSLAGS